jgi:hypothetical protein
MIMGSSPIDTDAFFTWVGKCITSWAEVEEHLFEICHHVLGSTRHRTAIVYFRTPTIDARLNLTDELLLSILPRKDRPSGGHDHVDVKTWNEIRKGIIALLPTRNRLAHHPVIEKRLWPELKEDYAGSAAVSLLNMPWYESYVSDAERLRGRHEDIKPLTVPDLSTHRVDVALIVTQLHRFRTNVLSKYAR